MVISARFAATVLAAVCALLALGVNASQARPARSGDQVVISFVTNGTYKAAFDVLIPNFERVYPNIRVDVTYAANSSVEAQLVSTELAAGNGPDVIGTLAGCGATNAVCALAPAGYLAPMVKVPWVRWSLPSLISIDK